MVTDGLVFLLVCLTEDVHHSHPVRSRVLFTQIEKPRVLAQHDGNSTKRDGLTLIRFLQALRLALRTEATVARPFFEE